MMESKEIVLCSQPDLAYNSGENYILSVGFTIFTYEIGTNNIYLVVNAFKVWKGPPTVPGQTEVPPNAFPHVTDEAKGSERRVYVTLLGLPLTEAPASLRAGSQSVNACGLIDSQPQREYSGGWDAAYTKLAYTSNMLDINEIGFSIWLRSFHSFCLLAPWGDWSDKSVLKLTTHSDPPTDW